MTTVPTDRPPRQRPPAPLAVAAGDVARYGPGAAITIAALHDGPASSPRLGERTGLDFDTLMQALGELLAFGRVMADPHAGWRLVDDLGDLRAHVEATASEAELEASNIPAVDR